MNTNRYKGDCRSCGLLVPAEAGFYYGATYCTESIDVSDDNRFSCYWDVCLNTYNKIAQTNYSTSDEVRIAMRQARDEAITEFQSKMRLQLVNGGLLELAHKANVRSLDQVVRKVIKINIPIVDLDFKQACAVRNELENRISRKSASQHLIEHKANNICTRCGGAGRSDKWTDTGFTCYKCEGTGKYFIHKSNPKESK